MAQFGDAKGEYRGIAHRNGDELTAWISKRTPEAALEPDLPIIDPHHHLWDMPHHGRYLLPELLADIGGHNIVATVFIECHAMYRQAGPREMAPVGEVEFANGIAAMSASGGYGPCRGAETIISGANLTLGARVRETLEAQIRVGGGRVHGMRHSMAWNEHEAVNKFGPRDLPAHLARDEKFREGFAQLAPLGLSFDALQYHPQLPETIDLARAFPDTTIIIDHVGGVLSVGPIAAGARKCLRGGKRTSPNWRNARTST